MYNRRLSIISASLALITVVPLAIAADNVKVTKVVDGDTLHVLLNGEDETIRIIGIDTPETVDPRKDVQCFGKEASARMTKLVKNKKVTLVENPADNRDKYDRLLRYVELKGKDIGAQLISEGYAYSYKQYPHPRLEDYNALEVTAREGNKGLWESCGAASSSLRRHRVRKPL
ncbi:MAG: Micrococcal nuclease [Candidatus Peribacteria bacterium]|nr:Micrococcal nuclease [Candidatus Peribacteria bacterium]